MEIKKISPLLKKKPWKRLVTPDAEIRPMTGADHYEIPTDDFSGLNWQYLTEFDLMAESCEGAHEINSQYMSKRPIYEVETRTVETPVIGNDGNPVLNEDGTPMVERKEVKEWVITGYENVETVRSGVPEMIIQQKASHLAKNGIEMANEGKDKERFDILRAWKEIAGIDDGWLQLIQCACRTGDAAIYLYLHNKQIEYTIFHISEGDQLFPGKDDKGNPMLTRMYVLNGKTAVDIYMTDYIETWVQADLSKTSDQGIASWWDTVKGWIKNISYKKSEDGWTRISRTETQLDNMTCQVVYLRLSDTPIGVAMQNINSWERGASYLSDKVRSTAFSKLFVKSAKIKNLPPLSSGEEVIGVENADAELLRSSSAEYLTPPDISNISEINQKNLFDAIMQSTMSIDLQPEILKSGADSSQTLKLLLRREIQWCHNTWPQVRPAAKQVITVLMGLVAKVEKDVEYKNLKVSVWNTPWMPVDEDAQATRVNQQIAYGVLSQKSGRSELNLQYVGEEEQIAKEHEAKIYRETYTKLKAEADARRDFGLADTAQDVIVDKINDDGQKTNVDNKAPNK